MACARECGSYRKPDCTCPVCNCETCLTRRLKAGFDGTEHVDHRTDPRLCDSCGGNQNVGPAGVVTGTPGALLCLPCWWRR